MKTEDVIQAVQSQYSRGVQSDDTRLSPRHIYNKLVRSRATLIERAIDKRESLSSMYYKTFYCVELEQVSSQLCPCLPARGCSVWKTKYPLPKTIHGKNTPEIDWIMTTDGRTITEETRDSYRNLEGKRISKKGLRYIRENEFLFIYGKEVPKYLQMRLLLEDFTDVDPHFNSCSDEPCTENCPECESPMDQEFPADMSDIDTIVQMAANELIILFQQSQQDVYNNTLDDKSPTRTSQPRSQQNEG